MSAETRPTDADRFDELLPFYVNGTLGDAERAFVEAHHAVVDVQAQYAIGTQHAIEQYKGNGGIDPTADQ